MTDETIALVRRVSLGLVALACLGYAGLALAQGKPDPVLWYIPGLVGLCAGIAITAAFWLSGPEMRRMADDEMYRETTARAQRHSYWIALALYPLFGLSGAMESLGAATTIAVMGTLTGAAYPALVTVYEWRMS